MATAVPPRITEPDEGLVHFVAPGITGNATLCGLTDFIGHRRKGAPTSAACTCRPCLGIVEFVLEHCRGRRA